MCRLQDKPEIDWGETLRRRRQSLALLVFVVDGGETPLIESNAGNTHRYVYRVAKRTIEGGQDLLWLGHAPRVGLCYLRPSSLVPGSWLLDSDSEQGGWHNRPVIGICIELLFIAPRSRLRSSQNREIIGNNFACWIDWFAFLGPKPKLQSLFVSVNSDGMCLDCCILILMVVDKGKMEIIYFKDLLTSNI